MKSMDNINVAKVIISSEVTEKYSADLLIMCIGQSKKDNPDISHLQHRDIRNGVKLGDFQGKEGEVFMSYGVSKKGEIQAKRSAYIGVGKFNESVDPLAIEEQMRVAGGHIAKLAAKIKAKKICVLLPNGKSKTNKSRLYYCLTEGITLGNYTFARYKTQDKKKKFQGIKEIRYIVQSNLHKVRKSAKEAVVNATAACFARNMANEPGNYWTAESFGDFGNWMAKEHGLKCTILEKKNLQSLGMGGILAVNRGSKIPPKLVILQYTYSKNARTVLLVGKGLTFDSGGISLKPAAGMEDMKYDMCGGAAVISAMHGVGVQKPRCNVVALIPTTDNMSGADALKPGDIIHHYNKTTSEIINTDAEGRLILADALAYGIEQYSPDYVVDLATLTGAVIIGLGHHHSGLLSNDDNLAEKLITAGKQCGEPMWRLPLGENYKKQLESKVADIKNTGGRPAGTITAAEYLHSFVGDTPWAHLDIAGTAWGFTEKSYIPKQGPSGICVRTLLRFIQNIE